MKESTPCHLGSAAAQKSIGLHFTECRVFLFDQCLIITEDNSASNTSTNSPDINCTRNNFHSNFGCVIYGSGSLVNQRLDQKFQRPSRLKPEEGYHPLPMPGGRSPGIRRPVHIRRHGSHLGSVDSDISGSSGTTSTKSGWSTTPDPFRQSAYKFIHAVRVNRMAFAVSFNCYYFVYFHNF